MARRVSHASLHARMTPSSSLPSIPPLYLFPLNNSVSRFYSLHFSRSLPHQNARAATTADDDDDDDLMTQYDFNLMHSPKRRKGKREEKTLPRPSLGFASEWDPIRDNVSQIGTPLKLPIGGGRSCIRTLTVVEPSHACRRIPILLQLARSHTHSHSLHRLNFMDQ